MSAQAIEDAPVACVRRRMSRWSKCPCPGCTVTRRRTDKHRRVGLLERIPSEAGWAALNRYVANGWTPVAIGDACDIKSRTIANLLGAQRAGRTIGISHEACRRLLSPVKRPTKGFIGSTGAQRRLQALAWLGFTNDSLRELTGISTSIISECQRGYSARISAAHAATIADRYQHITNDFYKNAGPIPGPSQTAHQRAMKLRYAPPAAWENIDDPNATPRGMDWAERPTPRQRHEWMRTLASHGIPVNDIAEHFECSTKTVERAIAKGAGVTAAVTERAADYSPSSLAGTLAPQQNTLEVRAELRQNERSPGAGTPGPRLPITPLKQPGGEGEHMFAHSIETRPVVLVRASDEIGRAQ